MGVNEQVLGKDSPYPRASPPGAVEKASARRRERHGRAGAGLLTTLFLVGVIGALAYGWMIRDRGYLVAGERLGYYLGVAGGVLLFLQFLYPLCKNLRFMRTWGAAKHWFHLHKMVGLLALVFILYHSNFTLHAVSSNVALFSMLLVVASGLAGHYLYAKLHSTRHGELLTLQELQRAFGISRDAMEQDRYIGQRVKDHLHAFEDEVFLPEPGVAKGFWNLLTLGQRMRRAWAHACCILQRDLHATARRDRWGEELLALRLDYDRELIRLYLRGVSRVVEFRFYSRLFGLWRSLHRPLFVMLVLTGGIHVIAVHLY